MTWGHYAAEPRNLTEDDVRRLADERVLEFIRSPRLSASMVPGTVPQQALVRPLVTTLPIRPADGDEVAFLADDAAGVVWRLRYRARAPSVYRWEFIGGSPLTAGRDGLDSTTSTTYVAGAADQSITIPQSIRGDYLISHGALMYQTTGGVGFVSYSVGSAAASDADAISFGLTTTGVSLARTKRKTLSGGSDVVLHYRTTANTLNIEHRWITVIPIRVGRS